MKELQRLTGGYKLHIDYLLTLQSEIIGIENSLFRSLGHDLVLSGCDITNHGNGTVTIAPGVVYVSGQIVRFAGSANVALGKAIVLNNVPVQTDPDVFFDGSTKNTYKELFAVIGNANNIATQIIVNTSELYNIKQYMHDIVQSYGQKGETKWVMDLDGTFIDNFDDSGLGVTPKWMGWALMNGNNGTFNMAGRSAVGVGRLTDMYGMEHDFYHNKEAGDPRHKLSESELASHSHDFNQSIFLERFDRGGTSNRYYTNGGINYGSLTVSKKGNDIPHNNMPPYRAGYYVMKIE